MSSDTEPAPSSALIAGDVAQSTVKQGGKAWLLREAQGAVSLDTRKDEGCKVVSVQCHNKQTQR